MEKDNLLVFDSNTYGKDGLAVITRGLSASFSQIDEKYEIGNDDTIITSFNTNKEYELLGACGVIYQGIIHFFGGGQYSNYRTQHFGFDEKRNFVKYENLKLNFEIPQCSTFSTLKPNSQSVDKEIVLLCFDYNHQKNCYQYADGSLTHFVDANESHYRARLGEFKNQLITVGGSDNKKTEILDRSDNGQYKWSLGQDYNFSPTGKIYHYSMVNVPQIGSNEEYLLLIGGKNGGYSYLDKVHKYNGKWSYFGNLQKTRGYHNSVLLNGRVFIIGGWENGDNYWTKTEVWDISKSRFETESTWPELNYWTTGSNNAFIVPEYTNP